MTDHGYRTFAREAMERARAQMDGQDAQLKYAALELRMAIEALVYDRLQIYRDEIARSDYETWQPKKVMEMMLDIDPFADQPRTIYMGLEELPGVEAKEMSYVGTENVLSIATIKKHYDALGSYLHLPTVKQYETRHLPRFTSLRERLAKIIEAIELVLNSNLTNASLTVFVELPCQRCGALMRKRAPKDTREVSCIDCGAEYRLEAKGEKVAVTPMITKLKCMSETCEEQMEFWKDDLKEGHRSKCKSCNQAYEIGLRLKMIDR